MQALFFALLFKPGWKVILPVSRACDIIRYKLWWVFRNSGDFSFQARYKEFFTTVRQYKNTFDFFVFERCNERTYETKECNRLFVTIFGRSSFSVPFTQSAACAGSDPETRIVYRWIHTDIVHVIPSVYFESLMAGVFRTEVSAVVCDEARFSHLRNFYQTNYFNVTYEITRLRALGL
jgi:hypothetical protein